MDFFHAQDMARRKTTRMVGLFILAVVSLIVMTNLLVMVLFGFMSDGRAGTILPRVAAQFDWRTFASIGVAVTTVIVGGSAYKILTLSRGGYGLAESLGGRLIYRHTSDLHERKALNVVEEMAIASGTPVPPLYVLEGEPGINAFAAGFTPRDAVIGLTRGALTHLTRDELQGVIGHEFSHILHGDMRLNMRLIGVLHGILLIGLTGYYLLRSVRRGSRKGSGAILGLGLGLVVIGYAGTFFGNLIKASISRQREFLADAAAVQFTRSKQGIAGALKKIGGYPWGSALATPQAPTMSHGYFCRGVNSLALSLLATHPPLAVRIKRLDPGWNGVFASVTGEVDDRAEGLRQHADNGASQAHIAQKIPAHQVAADVLLATQLVDNVGRTSAEHLDYAHALVANIPENIRETVHESYGAQALMYCLLMDRGTAIRASQLQRLRESGGSGTVELVEHLLGSVMALDITYRLPLIDMALPALRQLSAPQYQQFKDNLLFLMRADQRIDLFEWSFQHILFQHLNAVFGRARVSAGTYDSVATVSGYTDVVISMLVYGCVHDRGEIAATLNIASQALGLDKVNLLPRSQISIDTLSVAMDHLARLRPLLKPRLLKACMAVVTRDQQYSPREMELMRALADALDCPLPPYLGGVVNGRPSDRCV